MKRKMPEGTHNSLEGQMYPDMQAAVQVFAAHWRKVNAAWTYPEHVHPLFEFNVVLEGKQKMVVNGQTVIQSEGDILLIRPQVAHRSDGSAENAGMVYFSLHFDIDDPALRKMLLAREEPVIAPDSPLGLSLHEIFRSYLQPPSPSADLSQERLVAQRSAFRLFAALCDWALAQSRAEGGGPPERAAHPAHKLAGAMERLLCESVTGLAAKRTAIEDIAASLGYSPAYCNKAFKQVYGVSPRQYLSGLIVREAKLLLMDRRLSVDEIAVRLGYRDVSHFSKQFKRWTGISPLGYRRLSH